MRRRAWTREAIAVLAVTLACAAAGALIADPAAAQSSRSRGEGRGWLGVYLQDIRPELREALDLKEERGVLITRVTPDGPADRGGLMRRDFIVRINDHAVDDSEDLTGWLERSRPGQSVSIVVVRDGERRTLNLRLGERPSGREAPEATRPPEGDDEDREIPVPDVDGESFHLRMPDDGRMLIQRMSSRGRLGVRVEDLNEDLGQYFGARDGKGVLILEVTKDTPAQRVGLKAGDVIVQVEGQPVASTDELIRALRDNEGATRVTVIRDGQRRTFEPVLEKREEAMGLGMRDHDRLMRLAPRAPAAPRADLRRESRSLDRQDAELREEVRRMREELRELREKLQELERD